MSIATLTLEPNMKTTDQTTTTTSNDQLDTIDMAALDAVTGGCGGCGQSCANGPAPVAVAPNVVNAFAALSAFSRR